MHFILKKWRKFPILKILYNQHLYFGTHFHWSWRVLQNMSEVRLLGNKSRKYVNDARPWNFQGNLQNRRTVVTEHDNRRARRAENPDNAENVVPWDVYFENSRGGGVRNPPPPPTPSRSAPALALILLYISCLYSCYLWVFFLSNPNKTQRELLAVLGQSVHFAFSTFFFFYRILVDSSTLPKKN